MNSFAITSYSPNETFTEQFARFNCCFSRLQSIDPLIRKKTKFFKEKETIHFLLLMKDTSGIEESKICI